MQTMWNEVESKINKIKATTVCAVARAPQMESYLTTCIVMCFPSTDLRFVQTVCVSS